MLILYQKDLALVKVDKTFKPLSVISDNLGIGQEVYAIGAPRDMTYTMTKGIISALDRRIGQNTYIQIDASVNSGNSGGPLLDENGNVIGIITLKASNAEGIGFAINARDINTFVEEAFEKHDSSEAKAGEEAVPDNDGKDVANGRLTAENSRLKATLFISVILNVMLGLLCIRARLKNVPKKKNDELDFEIEIEE